MLIASIHPLINNKTNSSASNLLLDYVKVRSGHKIIFGYNMSSTNIVNVSFLGNIYSFIVRLVSFILIKLRVRPALVRLFQELIFDVFFLLCKSNTSVEDKLFLTCNAYMPLSCLYLRYIRKFDLILLAANQNDNKYAEVVRTEMHNCSLHYNDIYNDKIRLLVYNFSTRLFSYLVCINGLIKESYADMSFVDVFSVNYVFPPNITQISHVEATKKLTVINVGLIAHFSILKGLHRVIPVFNKLEALGYEFKLNIAGTFDEAYLKYIKSILDCNHKFCGCIAPAEKEQFYLDQDFVIVSSMLDASPTTLCETMKLGITPICSAGCGNSFLINHGFNGFVYDPHSDSELFQIITSILENRCNLKELGFNAMHTINEVLSHSIFFNEIDAIISKIKKYD